MLIQHDSQDLEYLDLLQRKRLWFDMEQGRGNMTAGDNAPNISQPRESSEIEAGNLADKFTGPTANNRSTDISGARESSSDKLSSELQRTSGTGESIPDDFRTELEDSTGQDYSNVRLHTDDRSKEMVSEINAKAFTHGNDIYMPKENHDLSSPEGQNLLAEELIHTTQNNDTIYRYLDQDQVDDYIAMGEPGWEAIFKDIVEDGIEWSFSIYLPPSSETAIKAIQTNPDFLVFIQKKTLGSGRSAFIAMDLLVKAGREAFIDRASIAKTVAGELEYIKAQVNTLSPPQSEEDYDRFISDIDWMISNLKADKFPLHSLKKIKTYVNIFLSKLDNMLLVFSKMDEIENGNSGHGAKLSVGLNRYQMEHSMYSYLTLINPRLDSITFSIEYDVWGWEMYRGLYHINLSLNRGNDTDQMILLIENDLNAASTAFYNSGGQGALWHYIDVESSKIQAIKDKGTFMPSEKEYQQTVKILGVIAVELAVVGFSVGNYLMKKFIKDASIANPYAYGSSAKTAIKTLGNFHDKGIQLLSDHQGDIEALQLGLNNLVNDSDYKKAVQKYRDVFDAENTINAIKDVAAYILELIFDVAVTVAAIYTGGVAGMVTRGVLASAIGEIAIIELGVLAAESYVFTAVNRTFAEMKQLVKTGEVGLPTSFGEDYKKNFLLFGTLKAVAGGYSRLVSPSKSLKNQTGLFIVEMGTLTGFEMAYLAWENGGITAEQQKELLSWESLGRSAVFLLCLKATMSSLQNHIDLLRPHSSNKSLERVTNEIQETADLLNKQKSHKGLETKQQLKDLQTQTKNLIDAYKATFKSAQKSGKLSKKDSDVIQKIPSLLETVKAEIDRLDIINKYNIKPSASKDLMTFEAKNDWKFKEFKKDLTRLKVKGEFKTIGTLKNVSGDIYIFKPFESYGDGVIYFRRISQKAYNPSLSRLSEKMFGEKAQKAGKSPLKYVKDAFKRDFVAQGGKFDKGESWSGEYNNIVRDAIKRGWDPSKNEGLPYESYDAASKYFAEIRAEEFRKQIETKELTSPSTESILLISEKMSQSQIDMVVEKLGAEPTMFGENCDYLTNRVKNLEYVKNIEVVPEVMTVEFTSHSRVLIKGAELIGDPLNKELKTNVELAKQFNRNLEVLSEPAREKLINRAESDIKNGTVADVVEKMNTLLDAFPIEARNELADILAGIKDIETYDRYINNLKYLPANRTVNDLHMSVVRTSSTNKLPKFNRDLKIKNERKPIFKKQEIENPTGADKLLNEAALPYSRQFAGGTFYFHPDLNYAIKARIESGINPKHTQKYFENLHKQYPNGIKYDANGIPDMRTIAVKETQGEISKDGSGNIIEVDLSDKIEMQALGLENKIDGLTPIESKYKNNQYHQPTGGENRKAIKAEKTDVQHANLIMKKRWKARGYGKWVQPEGTAWYFVPRSHKMILVRVEELNLLNYKGNTRYTDLVKGPKKPKEIYQSDPITEETNTADEAIVQYVGMKKFRIKNGTYEWWNAAKGKWDKITLEKYLEKLEKARAPFKEKAQNQVDLAWKVEKKTSEDLQEVSSKVGGELAGFEYRVKSTESLTRKLISEGIDTSIKDVLRYTIVLDKTNFTVGVQNSMKNLKSLGYKTIKIKNSFQEGQVYKGINTQVKTPDGYIFELQYHTPESFDVKQNINHDLYEKYRLLDPKSQEAIELRNKMIENSNRVELPENVEDIK